MSDELADFYVHTVTVETYLGTTGYGADSFAAPAILMPPLAGCFVEQKRRMVRDKDGAEVVSETSVYTYPAAAAKFTPGSKVTINGAESRVITLAVMDSGDLDLPDHIIASLT